MLGHRGANPPRIVTPPLTCLWARWWQAARSRAGFSAVQRADAPAGIAVVGTLPAAIQIETVFASSVVTTSKRPDAVRALLAFMASDDAENVKRWHGMAPA
jgi:molybdate transport system substrate-binding protein